MKGPAHRDRWVCPICQTVLQAGGQDKGEGIRVCPNCRASWFMLLCRRPSQNVDPDDRVDRQG